MEELAAKEDAAIDDGSIKKVEADKMAAIEIRQKAV